MIPISELLPPSHSETNVATYFTSLLTWTTENDMQLNTSKTDLPQTTYHFLQPQQVQFSGLPLF